MSLASRSARPDPGSSAATPGAASGDTSTGTRTRKASGGDPRATPAMRQYARFKKAHPDCVLFFRMGDFYEMFDEDAVTAHRALGITLTERTKGVPMAGVPYHAVEGYLRRMIEQGHRVAVCEQVEDASQAKGVVERAVTRVVTPGTLVDETLLDEGRANQIAAIVLEGPPEALGGGVALVELSTGAFTLHRIAAGTLLDELERLQPNELLYADDGHGPPPALEAFQAAGTGALTPVPPWMFRPRDAVECLRAHFGVATLEGFGLSGDDALAVPAGALLLHLRQMQSADDDAAARLRHVRPPRVVADSAFLAIDATSLRSLEIERTMRSGGTDGSLLATLQRCRTPMGKRLVRQWLCFPLRDRSAIERRQRAVAALVDDAALLEMLQSRLAGVQDVARIAARVAMDRATPRDIVAMGRSVAEVGGLATLFDGRPAFEGTHRRLVALAETLAPLAAHIGRLCVDSPPPHLREGGLFRDGIDAELDEARGLQRDGGAWLTSYQQSLVERTGIPSLKVGYNRVFGYYIEVTNAHAAKVPADFVRRQTLRGAERYITADLKAYEDKAASAEARALQRERDLFAALCVETGAAGPAAAEFAELVAALDVLACFADTAVRNGYCRPEIVEEPTLDIAEGRHPVLDRTLGRSFVPNDCRLRSPARSEDDSAACAASLALITGPNMAGKSTFIRQVALVALLAHTGSFVPASRAVVGLADRIFTRIGASDELHAGQSTFMVEMTETANILHHATERSIVILDEIGRGTSTLDGLSLAWAVAETLAARRCRTLFATHYHELTGLAERLPEVANLHVAVREWGDEIVFLHRILPGRTDRSYGIHVARLAGMPAPTVARAEQLLATLEVQTEPARLPRPDDQRGPSPGEQLGLFVEYLEHPVVKALRDTRLEALAPLEAFDLLRSLVEQARQGGEQR
ncbi:MAG: DNA mismatch repair protein MutS [Phycisphaerales bacterium]|nr:DNA mismatch repair protein MutS [Phycisphaerales bacterium]